MTSFLLSGFESNFSDSFGSGGGLVLFFSLAKDALVVFGKLFSGTPTVLVGFERNVGAVNPVGWSVRCRGRSRCGRGGGGSRSGRGGGSGGGGRRVSSKCTQEGQVRAACGREKRKRGEKRRAQSQLFEHMGKGSQQGRCGEGWM